MHAFRRRPFCSSLVVLVVGWCWTAWPVPVSANSPGERLTLPLAAGSGFPLTPDAVRDLYQGFSWDRTLPVPELDPVTADPELFYALIYVRDRADLELLDTLRIHYDSLPLFEEDREPWIDATAGDLPFWDEPGRVDSGGFVFAVIPGVTYNLIRSATLCPAPRHAVIPFRTILLVAPPVAAMRTVRGSLSYDYLAREGFRYRGAPGCDEVNPDDPDPEAACQSDAEIALALENADDPCSPRPCLATATTGVVSAQAEQRFRFRVGSRLKRFAGRVTKICRAIEDLVRKGIAKLAALFLGRVNLDLELAAHNVDAAFGDRSARMRRAWGAERNRALGIPRVQVRVLQRITGRFRLPLPSLKIRGTSIPKPGIAHPISVPTLPDGLSVGRSDANGFARVRAVKGRSARVCVRLESPAASLMNWVFARDSCAFEICSGVDGTDCRSRLSGEQLGGDLVATARFADAGMNVLMQASEANAYLRTVTGTTPARADFLVGASTRLVSLPDRAYAPCFGFPNSEDFYGSLLGAIGERFGRLLGRRLERVILEASNMASETLDQASASLDRWAEARLRAAGTTAAAAVEAAHLSAVGLRDAADALSLATGRWAELGRDLTRTLDQIDRARRRGASAEVLTALEEEADFLRRRMADLSAAAMRAEAALATARDRAQEAAAAAVAAATDTAAAASVSAAATATSIAASFVSASGRALALGANETAALAGREIGRLVAEKIGDLPDVILGDVDIVMPDGNAKSRGVPTHEYGHFAFCDLMYRASPGKFGPAWTDIAVETVVGQLFDEDQSQKPNVVINEGFADFFSGQVAAATNYFHTAGAIAGIPISYCGPRLDSVPPEILVRCLDDNLGAGTVAVIPGTSVPRQLPFPAHEDADLAYQVGRITTTIHDAFDGWPTDPPANVPGNGGAWSQVGGVIQEMVSPLGTLNSTTLTEERVQLGGGAIPKIVRAWLAGEPEEARLTEDGFFGGLATVARESFSYADVCRMFELHQPDDICPPYVPPGDGCGGTVCP